MYYEIQITIYEFENCQAGWECRVVKKIKTLSLNNFDEIANPDIIKKKKPRNSILQKSLAKIHRVP